MWKTPIPYNITHEMSLQLLQLLLTMQITKLKRGRAILTKFLIMHTILITMTITKINMHTERSVKLEHTIVTYANALLTYLTHGIKRKVNNH